MSRVMVGGIAITFIASITGCATSHSLTNSCIPAIRDVEHREIRVDPENLRAQESQELLALAGLNPKRTNVCWYISISTGYLELMDWQSGKAVTFSKAMGKWHIVEVHDVVTATAP